MSFPWSLAWKSSLKSDRFTIRYTTKENDSTSPWVYQYQSIQWRRLSFLRPFSIHAWLPMGVLIESQRRHLYKSPGEFVVAMTISCLANIISQPSTNLPALALFLCPKPWSAWYKCFVYSKGSPHLSLALRALHCFTTGHWKKRLLWLRFENRICQWL